MEDGRQSILAQTNQLTTAVALVACAAYSAAGLWGSLVGLLPLLLYAAGLHRLVQGASRESRIRVLLGLLLFAIVAGAVTERPTTVGDLAWTFLVPMVAFQLLGPWAGLRWTALTLGVQGASAAAIHFAVFPSFEVPGPLAFQTLRFGLITATAGAFSWRTHRHFQQLLEKLQRADQAKSVFLANVSHELRTPLHGILGMTEAMLHRDLSPQEREDLEVVQRSGDTLVRLINDLLDLTKAEQGKLVVEQTPFDLDRLLGDVMQVASSTAVVETRLDAEPGGTVLGDPTRLRQVLSNLLSNAAKFTFNGEIVLRARERGPGEWCFTVIDTGLGMSPETVEGLFTPFRQADASIARRFGGTGLGLALAKTLTERMGGAVTVNSTLGKGTTFEVTLPLPPTTQAPTRPVAIPRLEHLRLLVVDDNAINLKVARSMLERLRCQVQTASTGEEAVQLARTQAFDLVLMDCGLPGIDGWEATRQLHALSGQAQVPVLALTASTSAADAQRCRESGMVKVLTKPLAFGELCRALEPFAREVSVDAQ